MVSLKQHKNRKICYTQVRTSCNELRALNINVKGDLIALNVNVKVHQHCYTQVSTDKNMYI